MMILLIDNCLLIMLMDHYDVGGISTISILKAKMSRDEFNGFCKGNVYKYLTRSGHKGHELEDLRKASDYLTWLIEAKEEYISLEDYPHCSSK